MFGVLWLNTRNSIIADNPTNEKKISFIKNKEKTKQFLYSRGIPVPKTLAFFETKHECESFDFFSLPSFFVVKPNMGSKGNGILINTHSLETDEDCAKIRRHCLHILSWDHSPSWRPDSVLIEACIMPWWSFDVFCEWGLADIRVIAYRNVPVLAMVRVPTQLSWWKANLAQGWLWLGVDLASWMITSVVSTQWQYTYETSPDHYRMFFDQHVPYREMILELSSRIQIFLGIDYVWFDRVISDQWPMILEINGRPWLEIQNITMTPLLTRLSQMETVTVSSPKKAVALAQMLWWWRDDDNGAQTHDHDVLYLSQQGKITTSTSSHDVIVQIDLNRVSSFCSPSLYALIQWDARLTLLHLKKNFPLVLKSDPSLTNTTVILGRKFCSWFLILPKRQPDLQKRTVFVSTYDAEMAALTVWDVKINKYYQALSFKNTLFPTNVDHELDLFVRHEGEYDPHFSYAWQREKIIRRHAYGLKLLTQFDKLWLQSPFAVLLRDKLLRWIRKRSFLLALDAWDYDEAMSLQDGWLLHNRQDYLAGARERVQHINPRANALGRRLSSSQAQKLLSDHLVHLGYDDIPVLTRYSWWAKISLGYTSKWACVYIQPRRLHHQREHVWVSKLIHELDVHLVRYSKWFASGWKLLTIGTADYKTTEEWLAIYLSEQYVSSVTDGQWKNTDSARNYLFVQYAKNHSFAQTASYIDQSHDCIYSRTKKWATLFDKTLRVKMGVKEWVDPRYAFWQDSVYRAGYHEILSFLEQGNDLAALFKGKIGLHERDLIQVRE